MDREDIIENTKRGRLTFLKDGGKFGRPPKKVPVDYVVRERKKPIKERKTWKELGVELNVSVPSLIKALKSAGLWDEEMGTVK